MSKHVKRITEDAAFRRSIKLAKAERVIFTSINTSLLLILVFVTLYPFWNTIVLSFNEGLDSIKGGITFWPRKFSLQNYKAVFITGTVFNAFKVSVLRTLIQTVISLYLTTMLAYALSRKEFILRKQFTTLIVISMYVSAGLIPQYFLIRSIGLINKFAVYIVPSLLYAFNFIVIRTYIRGLPDSFIESAKIDGAGEFKIFMSIIFPLCKPVLATIGLFIAVGAWNDWFSTFLYTSSKQHLHTLQYKLMEFLQSSQNQAKSAADVGSMAMSKVSSTMVTPVSIRAAITVVAAVPILLVYPFLQKHFVAGIAVGGVKE